MHCLLNTTCNIFVSVFVLDCFREATQLPNPFQGPLGSHEAQSTCSGPRRGTQPRGHSGIQGSQRLPSLTLQQGTARCLPTKRGAKQDMVCAHFAF